MSQIIFLIVAIWIICVYPQALIGTILTLCILYYCPKIVEFVKSAEKKSGEQKDKRPGYLDDYTDENGVIDWENFIKDKVKAAMKPDFEKDPEWQKKSAEIRKHMDENRKRNEEEEQEELNKETKEYERKFYSKIR